MLKFKKSLINSLQHVLSSKISPKLSLIIPNCIILSQLVLDCPKIVLYCLKSYYYCKFLVLSTNALLVYPPNINKKIFISSFFLSKPKFSLKLFYSENLGLLVLPHSSRKYIFLLYIPKICTYQNLCVSQKSVLFKKSVLLRVSQQYVLLKLSVYLKIILYYVLRIPFRNHISLFNNPLCTLYFMYFCNHISFFNNLHSSLVSHISHISTSYFTCFTYFTYFYFIFHLFHIFHIFLLHISLIISHFIIQYSFRILLIISNSYFTHFIIQ